MINRFYLFLSSSALFLIGCSGGPSDSDIKKKLLQEYVCMETAGVENLNVKDKQDAETVSGVKGYVYTVSGEVVWKDGCKEFGTGTPPGFKEKFENKKVYLVKVDGEWQ